MKTFVVIGLGRFGSAVATELSSLGHEVLAVDEREDHVQRVAEKVTHAVTVCIHKAAGINLVNYALFPPGSLLHKKHRLCIK